MDLMKVRDGRSGFRWLFGLTPISVVFPLDFEKAGIITDDVRVDGTILFNTADKKLVTARSPG